MPETTELLKCPFCLSQSVEAKSGVTICSECNAQFEIGGKVECVFGKTDNIRLPAIGTICTSCGILQAGSHQKCLYCGAVICTAVQ